MYTFFSRIIAGCGDVRDWTDTKGGGSGGGVESKTKKKKGTVVHLGSHVDVYAANWGQCEPNGRVDGPVQTRGLNYQRINLPLRLLMMAKG